MLFEAKNGPDLEPGPAGVSGGFLLGLLSALVGLALISAGPAAAQGSSSSGPGRGPGEFYAPYRGNPEDEPRRPAIEPLSLEEATSLDYEAGAPEAPPAVDWGAGEASGDNDGGAWPEPAAEAASGPSGQATERSEMLFLDPDDPDYDKIPPADLPRPEEYPDLTVVPLPPTASPPLTARPEGAGLDGPAGPERAPAEIPAGASPALSVYPEQTRSALPKSAVPGLVTQSRDVALLERLRKNNDPAGALAWERGAEISWPGLQADAEGRLSGLNLENLGLSGRLDLSGAEALLELRSVGNPLTSLRLGGLRRLQRLSLSGAALSRLDRLSLAGLSGLSSLELTRSGLAKIDPGALAGLSSLLTLDLSGNQLEQLGRGWFNGLEALEELDLNANQISEVKWGALAPLTGLVTLQLADNHLTEIHGGFFPGLSNLEILYLEKNRLTHLTRDALAGLPALKYIDLSNNYLKSMPPLAHLENLSELDLMANCLSLGAMKDILAAMPENSSLHLRGQQNVYFGLRVQLLPDQDHYLIPAADAFIGDIPSHGRILGADPAGASYQPAEAAGQPGRLTFHRPGLYTLLLSNSGLGDGSDFSAATGAFLVVDSCPDPDEAAERLGHRDLVTGLVQALASRGFVEAPSANPKRISALKAIFSPPQGWPEPAARD